MVTEPYPYFWRPYLFELTICTGSIICTVLYSWTALGSRCLQFMSSFPHREVRDILIFDPIKEPKLTFQKFREGLNFRIADSKPTIFTVRSTDTLSWSHHSIPQTKLFTQPGRPRSDFRSSSISPVRRNLRKSRKQYHLSNMALLTASSLLLPPRGVISICWTDCARQAEM